MSPAAVPLSADPFADRRAAPRVAVALPGFMTFGGVRHSVQFLDVSVGGAKIATTFDGLGTGMVVDLDCGIVRRSATVRWAGGGTAGLSFERELDSREEAAIVNRSNALQKRMTPPPSRPD